MNLTNTMLSEEAGHEKYRLYDSIYMKLKTYMKLGRGVYLVVQWLRIWALANTGDTSSISRTGGYHIPQSN